MLHRAMRCTTCPTAEVGTNKHKRQYRGTEFIVISAVIGGGIFTTNATALHVAGPGGFIVATVVIGFIAICVMESISELVQLFPCPNAVVEYTRAFVDKDLAWVVGIAYWYTYAAIFAGQNLAIAQLGEHWIQSKSLEGLVYFTLLPILLLFVNLAGVLWYGVVETIGGALKLLLVFGGSIAMFVLSGQKKIDTVENGKHFEEHYNGGTNPILAGFQSNAAVTENWAAAICYAIPLIAFSFLGLEAVTVTAVEVRDVRTSRWPSRYVAYIVLLSYLLCVFSYCVTIDWQNEALPGSKPVDPGPRRKSWAATALGSSNSPLVLASLATGHRGLAGFFQGCCMFSVVSAANTSLYIASRTFYGLCLDLQDHPGFVKGLRWFFTSVRRSTKAPFAALLFCVFSFFWVPFIHFVGRPDVINIIAVSASVSCLFVWAVLCIAFIRYERWLRICFDAVALASQDLKLRRRYKDITDPNNSYGAQTLLGTRKYGQPLIAWIGLFGCIGVFALAGATWWKNPSKTSTDAATAWAAYAALGTFFVLFMLFKLIRLVTRRSHGFVRLENDPIALKRVLETIRFRARDRRTTPRFLDAAKTLVQDWFYHLSTGEPHTPNGRHPEAFDIDSTTPVIRDADSGVFEDEMEGHEANGMEMHERDLGDITGARGGERHEEGGLWSSGNPLRYDEMHEHYSQAH